jgi:hypothetical protein
LVAAQPNPEDVLKKVELIAVLASVSYPILRNVIMNTLNAAISYAPNDLIQCFDQFTPHHPGRMDAEFASYVGSLDGLVQEAQNLEGPMAVVCSHVQGDIAVITSTNAAQVWRAKLGLVEFRQHRTQLGMKKLPLEKLCEMIKTAFGSKDTLELQTPVEDVDQGSATLSLTYSLPALEMHAEFVLVEINEEKEKAEALATLFGMLLRSKVAAAPVARHTDEDFSRLELDNRTMQRRIQELEREVSEMRAEQTRAARYHYPPLQHHSNTSITPLDNTTTPLIPLQRCYNTTATLLQHHATPGLCGKTLVPRRAWVWA